MHLYGALARWTVMTDMIDALVISGGPAGLTTALYLARFRRRVAVADEGDPRAAWIPASHNIPFFAEGILALARQGRGFVATLTGGEALRARHVLLATGARDVEPALPDLPDAVRRGLVRYCPVCDGFESRDRRIAVIGHGAKEAGEALFIARSYSDDVTLLTLGVPMEMHEETRARLAHYRVRIVERPVMGLDVQDGRVVAIHIDGEELRFDTLYSALGLRYRTGLAEALGAAREGNGALSVDAGMTTSVPGLYAAGDIVAGLDQIVVGMGHAAIAATRIHNSCARWAEEEG